MAWNMLDYARKDCKYCGGSGLDLDYEWYDWGLTSIPVPRYYECRCITDRLEGVMFKYYGLIVSSNGDTEDDIPF